MFTTRLSVQTDNISSLEQWRVSKKISDLKTTLELGVVWTRPKALSAHVSKARRFFPCRCQIRHRQIGISLTVSSPAHLFIHCLISILSLSYVISLSCGNVSAPLTGLQVLYVYHSSIILIGWAVNNYATLEKSRFMSALKKVFR